MVLVGLEQSEQQCEEFIRNHKKRDRNCPGSFFARDRGRHWTGEFASTWNYQYPHYAFFFGWNLPGFNHFMGDI
jgi:hypothetical protein